LEPTAPYSTGRAATVAFAVANLVLDLFALGVHDLQRLAVRTDDLDLDLPD